VLLTLLADESGGWYGYLGTALGVLPYFSSHAPPAQWLVILPLVGAALIAGLIVKHAGGPLVLPFAFAAFSLPILLTERLGPSLDTTLTLPSNAQFRASSLGLAAAALAFSFVRQALGIYLRRRAEQPHPVTPLPDAGLPDA